MQIFQSQAAEDQNVGVQLLADIRLVFEFIADGKISSADLISKLKEIETSPWADWSKGKGLSANGLSRLLKPFGVSPRGIRVDEKTPKGYLRESFDDAFSRYLPHRPLEVTSQPQHPPQPASLLNETHFLQPPQKENVAVAKSALDPHQHCIVAAVAVANPLREGGHGKDGELTLPCPVHGLHPNWWVRIDPDGWVMTCGKCEQPSATESLFADIGPTSGTPIERRPQLAARFSRFGDDPKGNFVFPRRAGAKS